MKSLLIASLLLVALVSATPAQSSLRGNDRKLQLLGLGNLLNLPIQLAIPPLLQTIAAVNVSSGVSVNATIAALNLLKIDLNILLLGTTPGSVGTINANASVADLLSIISAVNLNDPTSILNVLNAVDMLLNILNGLLPTLPLRNLQGGLLGLNLSLNVLDLINTIVGVDVGNATSVNVTLNALGLLQLKLNVQLLLLELLGGVPGELLNLTGATVGTLTGVIQSLNLSDITSVLNVLNAVDMLTGLLNGLLPTLPLRRNLGLINLNLTAEVLSLVSAIVGVDVGNPISVRVTIALLSLLKIDLDLMLPANVAATGLTVDANASVADLLSIIGALNLSDVTSILHVLDAVNLLIPLLTGLL